MVPIMHDKEYSIKETDDVREFERIIVGVANKNVRQSKRDPVTITKPVAKAKPRTIRKKPAAASQDTTAIRLRRL